MVYIQHLGYKDFYESKCRSHSSVGLYIIRLYTRVYSGCTLRCCNRWMDSVSWLALECAALPLCSLVSREFSMAAATMLAVAGAAVKVQHHSTHTHTAVLVRTSAIKRFTLTLGMTVTSTELLFESYMFQHLCFMLYGKDFIADIYLTVAFTLNIWCSSHNVEKLDLYLDLIGF